MVNRNGLIIEMYDNYIIKTLIIIRDKLLSRDKIIRKNTIGLFIEVTPTVVTGTYTLQIKIFICNFFL